MKNRVFSCAAVSHPLSDGCFVMLICQREGVEKAYLCLHFTKRFTLPGTSIPIERYHGDCEQAGLKRSKALEQQTELLKLKKEHLENLIDLAAGIKALGVKEMKTPGHQIGPIHSAGSFLL